MTFLTAIAAGIGCSLCDGISTLQQKVGADESKRVSKFNLLFLLTILKNLQYVSGTVLAIIGYGLCLMALRVLPLFLMQSLIAASIIVTAIGERFFLHRRIGRRTYYALVVVLIGTFLLSIGAIPGAAVVHGSTSKLFIELAPLPLAAIGVILVYIRNRWSAASLAALGGLLFGNTSTIGRIFIYPHPIWKVVENPLLYSLSFCGILGQYFFIVALQRASATKSNAVMVAMQTLGPTICGLLLFNDRIRSGFELFIVLGCVLVIAGAGVASSDKTVAQTI